MIFPKTTLAFKKPYGFRKVYIVLDETSSMKLIKFKKIGLLEQNEAYQKVIHWFFSYPTKEVSLNDIVKLTHISKTTARKVVKQLAKEEFLKVNILGKIWRITSNQNHFYNTTRKIAYNLELIYQSGLIDGLLGNFQNIRSITLFGSYRKGDDIETSDLDIAVEVLDAEETKISEIGVIPRLGYREKVKVNMLKFNRSKVDLNLFANIANGIVLHGFLEVRP